MLKLVFVSGPNAGNEFILESEFAYIGREVDNSVVLDDAKLSRYHFCVAQAPEGYEVIDNQSTNGTYLNGARIERQFLQTGDEIQVGNSLIRIEISGAAQAAVSAEPTTGSFSIQSSEGSFDTHGDYITAGRSGDNHIHIDDQKVSREHAHLIFRDGKYFIKDNSSVNGTFFKRAGESDEKRIVEEPIQNGDEARLGSYKLKFSYPTPRLLQVSVIDPSVSDEYGVEAANEVEENDEKQQEVKVAEFDLPKPSADQVMEYIPKDIAERGAKQRFATLIVDAIPKAVLEATKDAKEEKRKVPAWVATSDVVNDGRRFWYVGGSVAMAGVLLLAMFLTGFTRPFMNRPLSKFHQSEKFYSEVDRLDLGDGCKACHTTFKGVEVGNCQKCHGVEWTPFGQKHHDNADFNTAAKERGKREECLACHSEHMGVDYSPAAPEITESGCWSCHRNAQDEPKRGYHENDKPKYAVAELISQDTGQPFVNDAGQPYKMGAPGLDSKSFGDGDETAWRNMLHEKHGEVPGYCNSCHGPREVTVGGKKELRVEPKQSCLDCHQVDKDASCLTCHDQHKNNPRPGGTATADIQASALSKIPGAAAGGVMALLLFIPAFVFALNKRRKGEIIPVNQEVKAQKDKLLAIEKMKAEGKFEKVTVIIKKELCIGCSGCVNSCPYDVLEIDQATHKSSVVAMEKCLGDMKCSKACPTGACIVIKGDKIPEVEQVTINENHESNVPGLYVIGEGCGKPLIKNAINHGKIAIDHIASQPGAKGSDADVYDVIVVGSGPGGLSAGCSAKEHGLKYLILEKATDTTDTIRNFPKAKVVLAEPVSIPLAGKLWMEDTNKETLIAKWEEIIKKTGLVVTLNQEAVDVSKNGDTFTVKTPKGSFKAKKVVLAPGTRGAPNKIGCPGEELMHPKETDQPRVHYRLTDTDPYKKKHCLVLGGGDSAVEAARSLADIGAIVTLAYRKEKFDRIKERNLEETLKYTKSKKIKLYLLGNCKELKNGPKGPVVIIKHEKGPAGVKGNDFALTGKPGEDELPNDYVFALLGAQAPSKFFKGCGIEVKKVKMA